MENTITLDRVKKDKGDSSAMSELLLGPLKDNERVTKTRKDRAMYALAKLTENTMERPKEDPWAFQSEEEWQLANIRKYGTVRIIKDKETSHWITTTFGRIDGNLYYYGLDVNTGEMIANDKAKELYHRSRA